MQNVADEGYSRRSEIDGAQKPFVVICTCFTRFQQKMCSSLRDLASAFGYGVFNQCEHCENEAAFAS